MQAFTRTSSRGACLLAALALSILLSLGAEPNKAPNEAPKVRLWVPAYFYPSEKGLKEWERLQKNAQQVPIVAIVNPNSGPGQKPDPNYNLVTARSRNAGLTLVGYVDTNYSKRDLDTVKAEVDDWFRFYPKIHGIFADRQSSEAAKVEYYAELYRYIRAKLPEALVMSNPGTECDSVYLSKPATETVCLYERDKGFENFRPPEWTKRFAQSRFGVIVYNVQTADKMREFVRAAVRHRTGNIYFTDATGENPYDRLPSYWEDEVEEVKRINEAK